MFRPFWVGFPYFSTIWGDYSAVKGRYKLPRPIDLPQTYGLNVGKYSIHRAYMAIFRCELPLCHSGRHSG